MNEKFLQRVAALLLILMTAIIFENYTVLHHIRDMQKQSDDMANVLKRTNAVLNQLCVTTKTACVYTLPENDQMARPASP
jgi:hypothetical protein